MYPQSSVREWMRKLGVPPDKMYTVPQTVVQGVFTFGGSTAWGNIAIPQAGGAQSADLGMSSLVQVEALGIGDYYLFGTRARIVIQPESDFTATPDELAVLAAVRNYVQWETVGGVRKHIHAFGGGGKVVSNLSTGGANIDTGYAVEQSIDFGWYTPKGGLVIDSQRTSTLKTAGGAGWALQLVACVQVEGLLISKSMLPYDPPIPEMDCVCAEMAACWAPKPGKK